MTELKTDIYDELQLKDTIATHQFLLKKISNKIEIKRTGTKTKQYQTVKTELYLQVARERKGKNNKKLSTDDSPATITRSALQQEAENMSAHQVTWWTIYFHRWKMLNAPPEWRVCVKH